jgi:hypothetical protein
MVKRFDPAALKKAGEEWDKHHEIVAAVRRLVRLTGGVQDAKDAIDGVDLADELQALLEEEEAAEAAEE